MVRTERESDRRRIEEKWTTCWCCRNQKRACRIAQASAEKLEHTGPAGKERVASVPKREQLASTPEPSVQIVSGERVKMSESRTLAREKEREMRTGAWGRKGGLYCEGRQVLRR